MKHTALTIGPIYKTFQQAKKTRELWVASYLFSYLMKKIISALKDADKKINIIIPYNDENLLKDKNEAGLFPDRLVFHTELSIDKIQGIIDKVVDDLATKIAGHIGEDNVKEYFKNYFQVYAVEKEFDDKTYKKDIVKNLFDALDALELQQKFEALEPEVNMRSFLTKATFKKGKQHSFLVQDAFSINDDDRFKFQSIIEITAKEIIDKLDHDKKAEFNKKLKQSFNVDKDKARFDEENDLVEILKSHDDFRTHHKYLAILQIDGDSFGKINQFLNNDDYQKFSESLANYSKQTKDIITGYGGVPIYIGGDDILAFVPVRNDDRNIFTLLDDIDKVFKKEFKYFIEKKIKDPDGNIIVPALSAGISVTYYKYPLNEALNLSYKLLFERAKNHPGKNAVAFEVVKHSGQTFCTVFGKNSDIYIKFRELIKLNIDDSEFFASVIQKFFENFELLEIIGKDEKRIHAYRENFYNEKVHGTKEDFLNELENYISLIFTQNKPKLPNKNKQKLYASLRMVKFLNRDDNE